MDADDGDETVKIRRILETALYCDDLARTARFYATLLDVSPMLSGDRLVALDSGEGTVLLLFSAATRDRSTRTAVSCRGTTARPGPSCVCDRTRRCAGWERRLGELGIAIESRVTWERGGESIYFRDPENRSVELATPASGLRTDEEREPLERFSLGVGNGL